MSGCDGSYRPPFSRHLGAGLISKVREFPLEDEVDRARWAVALFRDDQLGVPSVSELVRPVVFRAETEDDDVGVLLDGAGFAEIAHDRALIFAPFDRPVQLAQKDDRTREILRELLQSLADAGYFQQFIRG